METIREIFQELDDTKHRVNYSGTSLGDWVNDYPFTPSEMLEILGDCADLEARFVIGADEDRVILPDGEIVFEIITIS